LWREDGMSVQVAVVHRERYDDWSLPKGKLKAGELAISAAMREVTEESGAQVALSRRLGQVHYQVDGVDKSVWFWAMREVGGEFSSSAEVDQLEWLSVDDARQRLSYAGERMMLGVLMATPRPTSVVIVIRHARAGKRSDWSGPDRQRPLESRGRAQARALVEPMSRFAPTRIVSADPVRCVQTVQPLGRRLGLRVEVDESFSDRKSALDLDASRAALADIVRGDEVVAICSQGDTISALVGQSAAKGSAWVLGTRAGEVVSIDYYGAARR
jgi:8-oxo-dGTP diphosphatase